MMIQHCSGHKTYEDKKKKKKKRQLVMLSQSVLESFTLF